MSASLESATPARAPDAAACTIYHDGSCPLCEAEISLYRRMTPDVPVHFVDVSKVSPGDRVAEGLTGAEAMRRFHVRDQQGQLRSGADAFGLLWRNYPGFRWLGRLMEVTPLRLLAEGAYRAFLVTLRPILQRLVRARSARAASRRGPAQP